MGEKALLGLGWDVWAPFLQWIASGEMLTMYEIQFAYYKI